MGTPMMAVQNIHADKDQKTQYTCCSTPAKHRTGLCMYIKTKTVDILFPSKSVPVTNMVASMIAVPQSSLVDVSMSIFFIDHCYIFFNLMKNKCNLESYTGYIYIISLFSLTVNFYHH